MALIAGHGFTGDNIGFNRDPCATVRTIFNKMLNRCAADVAVFGVGLRQLTDRNAQTHHIRARRQNGANHRLIVFQRSADRLRGLYAVGIGQSGLTDCAGTHLDRNVFEVIRPISVHQRRVVKKYGLMTIPHAFNLAL